MRSQPGLGGAVVVVLALVGCKVNLAVPPGAQITCTANSTCPEGYECNVRLGLCIRPGANQLPSVVIGNVARTSGLVSLPLTVTDLESDAVTLSVEGTTPSDLHPLTTSPGTVASSSDGALTALEWNAAAALGGTGFMRGLIVRVTPRDPTGIGASVTSNPFDFGNDAPDAGSLIVEVNSSGAVSGIAVVRFQVADSSSDAVSVTAFEFSAAGDFSDTRAALLTTGPGTTFPAGGVVGLATTPEGAAQALIWDSEKDARLQSPSARIRLTLDDGFGGVATVVSAPFRLHNVNGPPVLKLTSGPAQGQLVSGPVPFHFSIDDPDNDSCLVQVEYSTDAVTWSPAASSSPTAALAPGPDYTFVWQSTQVGYDVYPSVLVRFSISDGAHPVAPVVSNVFAINNTSAAGNAPPTVILGTIAPSATGRFLKQVLVPFTLRDPNGPPLGNDSQTVTLRYQVGGGTWRPATLAAGSQVSGLDAGASAAGTAFTLTWDALADAVANNDLHVARIDLGDGGAFEDVVSSTSGVLLQLTARDTGAPPKDSNVATSNTFTLGNDPPQVSLSVVDGGAPQTGLIPVGFWVSDALSDPADAELWFRQSSADLWRRAKLGLGNTTSLSTDLVGKDYLVLWDSLAPLGASVDLAQGLGPQTLPAVELRMRASDHPAPGVTHWSGWSAVVKVSIRNQTPPRIEALAARSADLDRVTGALPVTFRVIDEQSDVTSVTLEYALAVTGPWHRLAEYPTPASEGDTGLASAPSDPATGGGLEHLFLWDSVADLVTHTGAARLRATPADAYGQGQPVELVLPNPVGLESAPGDDPLLGNPVFTLVADKATWGGLAAADVNGDGVTDVVVSVATQQADTTWTATLETWFGSASGDFTAAGAPVVLGTGLPTLSGTLTPRPVVSWAVAVGDFNADGKVDAVVTGRAGVGVLLGTGGSGGWGPMTLLGPPIAVDSTVAVADFNGDGTLDVMTVPLFDPMNTAAREKPLMMLGDSDGGFSMSSSPSFAAATNQELVVGDFNNDGRSDLMAIVGSAVRLFGVNAVDGGWLVMSTGVSAPGGLAVGDVDGDNQLDLVVACELSQAVNAGPPATAGLQIYRGVGDGTFVAGVSSNFGDSQTNSFDGLVLADLNDDGRLDAVGNATSAVKVAASHRGGTFTREQYEATLTGKPFAALAGRFTGHSRPDIVMAGQDDFANRRAILTVFPSTAPNRPAALFADAGTTVATVVYPTGGNDDWSADWFDVNGDGASDLFLGEAASTPGPRVWPMVLNSRQGTVGAGAFHVDGPISASGVPLLAGGFGDFDGDGVSDVLQYKHRCIATCNSSSRPPVMVLDAHVFSGATLTTSGPSPVAVTQVSGITYPWATELGDFSGDGLLDVAQLGLTPAPATWVLGVTRGASDGGVAGTTLAGATVSMGFDGGGLSWLTSGDFTGDGLTDFAVLGYSGNWQSPTLWVVVADGDGGVPSGSYSTLAPLGPIGLVKPGKYGAVQRYVPVAAATLVSADVNADGILDLIALANDELVTGYTPIYAATVEVLFGNGAGGRGDGTFRLPTAADKYGIGGSDLSTADFTGDGVLDVLVSSTGGAFILPGLSAGGLPNGMFGEPISLPATGMNSASADFNGDGLLDVILPDKASGAVQLFPTRRTQLHDVMGRAALPSRSGEGVVFGATTWPTPVPAQLLTVAPSVGLRFYDSAPRHDLRGGPAQGLDFRAELRRAPLSPRPPNALVPLTMAWVASGDRRLSRVSDAATGSRLRVEQRFGPLLKPGTSDQQRAGLDLAPTTVSNQRGLVFDLPIPAARPGGQVQSATSVRVYLRRTDWVRASAWPRDPISGQAGAGEFLPRAVTGASAQDVVRELTSWVEIPLDTDGNLETGTGRRFIVDQRDPANRRIRVLTDQLGVMQAFLEP